MDTNTAQKVELQAGKYDLALFRPGTGQWIIRLSSGATLIEQFGDPAHGDIAVPGDYDGDGKTDLAIFRPGTALFVIQYSGGGARRAIRLSGHPRGEVSHPPRRLPGAYCPD